ncbi:MAG TPA: S1C family serine protease, partial [Lacipirellula sp.]
PIDRIKSIVPELITHGHIVRADIGISHVMETEYGLVIARITPNGPADKAGLSGFEVVNRQRQFGGLVYNERGIDRSKADRIIAVDGDVMHSGVQFRDKIWEHKPGDVVTLTIVRQGRQLDVPVTLGGD